MNHLILHMRRRLFRKGEHSTIYQHHGVALLALLMDLLPVAATAAITYYVNTDYYVGVHLSGDGADDNSDALKLLGLQFAAKFHELLMISTLANVIFTIVRYELAQGNGIALAAISAGLSVPRVSFLWAKEFVALCKARYDKWYKEVLFWGAVVV